VVINAQFPNIISSSRAAVKVRRPGVNTFWFMFAIEAFLIAGAFLVVLQMFPSHTPLADETQVARVHNAVLARLNGSTVDPLIEVTPGVLGRSSNVRGFSLDGQTYYYYFEGRSGFDPLSRGVVSLGDVELVLRDDRGPDALVIYRMLNS
jgi:hypothetical protein